MKKLQYSDRITDGSVHIISLEEVNIIISMKITRRLPKNSEEEKRVHADHPMTSDGFRGLSDRKSENWMIRLEFRGWNC